MMTRPPLRQQENRRFRRALTARWSKAPPGVNARLRFTDATIIHLSPGHGLALIHATVNRGPHEYEVISRGDPQTLYLRTWTLDGGRITAEYRLVSRTVSRPGEVLPGPSDTPRSTRGTARWSLMARGSDGPRFWMRARRSLSLSAASCSSSRFSRFETGDGRGADLMAKRARALA